MKHQHHALQHHAICFLTQNYLKRKDLNNVNYIFGTHTNRRELCRKENQKDNFREKKRESGHVKC